MVLARDHERSGAGGGPGQLEHLKRDDKNLGHYLDSVERGRGWNLSYGWVYCYGNPDV